MPTSPSPNILWPETHIELAAYPGRTKTRSLTFTSDRDLTDVVIEPVPALSNLLSARPSALARVTAGRPQTIELIFSVPEGSGAGTHDGTVHIREGRQTLPQTLKVGLKVKEMPLSIEAGPISPERVTVSGADEKSFNPRSNTIQLGFPGVALTSDPAAVRLVVNGANAPAGNVRLTEESLTLDVSLAEGRNQLLVYVEDELGRLLYKALTLWAGSRTLTVAVTDERNLPVDGAAVTALLGDDPGILASAETLGGSARLFNLPDRTFLLQATASDNRFASRTTTGGAGGVSLRLAGLNTPSTIDNNDFSQGTAGWEVGGAPVRIVPHVEASALRSQTAAAPTAFGPAQSADPEAMPSERESRWLALQKEAPWGGDEVHEQSHLASAAPGGGVDLEVRTRGEGPQRVSRTFETKPGTLRVSVRYRFQTSEVPGNYYGSKYNDSFEVSIRSRRSGSVTFSRSMNSFLRSEFTDDGWTRWFKTSLAVEEGGDLVQVDASVSNVGDGILDSALYIDYVDTSGVTIGELFAVPKGGSASVEVKMAEDHPPVTLTLQSSGGEGEASFADGTTKTTITRTTTVEIKGVTESSEADDVRLVAENEDGAELDGKDFSVVWVTLKARGEGPISSDNSARAMAATPEWGGVSELGRFYYRRFQTYANMVQTAGVVSPHNYKHPIVLRKKLEAAYIINRKVVKTEGLCEYDPPEISDRLAEPNGRVYALDAPSSYSLGAGRTDVWRLRYRFQQWAELADDIEGRDAFECMRPEKVVSDTINWYSAISTYRPEGVVTLVNDVPGDNMGAEGNIELTWNLK